MPRLSLVAFRKQIAHADWRDTAMTRAENMAKLREEENKAAKQQRVRCEAMAIAAREHRIRRAARLAAEQREQLSRCWRNNSTSTRARIAGASRTASNTCSRSGAGHAGAVLKELAVQPSRIKLRQKKLPNRARKLIESIKRQHEAARLLRSHEQRVSPRIQSCRSRAATYSM